MARLYQIVRQHWLGYAAALGVVAVTSAVLTVLLPQIEVLPRSLAMLYLLAVVGIGSLFGSGPATLTAVLSWLNFDYFFVGPPNSLLVASDRDEAVIDLLLLVTSLVAGELASELRRRASQLAKREREASLLYDVVRLMSQPEPANATRAVAERLREALRLSAVRIELDDGGTVETAGESPGDGGAPQRIKDERLRRVADRFARSLRPAPASDRVGRIVHVVSIPGHGGTVGRMLLTRDVAADLSTADHRLVAAVAVQLGQSVERGRLQREATEAEILRRTDELKTALLNAVSHDLRTPLASILASAGSLLQDDVSWTEDDRREFAEGIRDEAARLNRIVENLLDLSRIEAGNLHPHKSWYDLRTLVDDVVERLRPLTARHGVSVAIPDDLRPVLVDAVEIDQVLSNLIENATKYAPAGTEIVISAGREKGETWVDVADQGPGIPSEAIDRLFEPFFQLRNRTEGNNRASNGTRLPGSGLGLAVARGLVDAHGGRIWAENRPAGGARFIFTLGEKRPEVALERQGV